jgi:hypothetical protein
MCYYLVPHIFTLPRSLSNLYKLDLRPEAESLVVQVQNYDTRQDQPFLGHKV